MTTFQKHVYLDFESGYILFLTALARRDDLDQIADVDVQGFPFDASTVIVEQSERISPLQILPSLNFRLRSSESVYRRLSGEGIVRLEQLRQPYLIEGDQFVFLPILCPNEASADRFVAALRADIIAEPEMWNRKRLRAFHATLDKEADE